jgi:trans-aconitate 2-methyltransferase
MPTWDASQYLQFADERTRPARDLLARVPLEQVRHAVDLGCGPGNSTALLRARWPDAHIVGVDSSPAMLERARRDWPQGTWIEADVRTFTPRPAPDLLFANALLQWLPDHRTLVPALFDALRPGGVLAVQVPRSFDEPAQRLARELARRRGLALDGVPEPSCAEAPEVYYDVLAPRAAAVDVWQTTYEHVMPDARAIVEWLKGTALRSYLDRLPEADRAGFAEECETAFDRAYPRRADGRRLYPFPRLFLVAVKPEGEDV